jgi:rhodanese-related sulfurtransferase
MADAMKGRPVILDVRTSQEFLAEHAPGSLNVPLDGLGADLPGVERDHPILVCCATGARSSIAKVMLERLGFSDVVNAGPWQCAMKMVDSQDGLSELIFPV